MQYNLRPWMIDDLDSLVMFANNNNIAKFMMDKFPHPYTREAGENFINFATQESPVNIFAIEVEGKAAGGIGLHPLQDVERMNAEMGYWLAEPYWGKGIITKAIMQMVDYGFTNFPIHRIFARPYGTNAGSQKALKKAGFSLQATLPKWAVKNDEELDILIYTIQKK